MTTQHHHYVKISDILVELLEKHVSEKVSFGDIAKSLHERGFGFLMIIFVLPGCVPVPIPPGLSTIIAIPLIFLSSQMIMGKDHPWFPAWLSKKSISRSTLALLINKVLPKLRWIETFLKPRFTFIKPKTKGERMMGLLCLILSVIISQPVPFTHFLPSMGVLLISIGMINRDGLVTLCGVIAGFAGIIFVSMIYILGEKAVMALVHKFIM